MKTRIAVLNTHPIQYFAPLYAFLNQDPHLEVAVLYLSDYSVRGGRDEGFGRPVTWDLDLLSGYSYRFLGEAAKRRSPSGSFFSIVAPEVCSAIRDGGYDALWLHGHGYAANILALVAARSIGLPVLMRCDTHLKLRRGRIKKAMRGIVLGNLYSQCDRFLAIGSANEAFYRSLGVPKSKIFPMPYAVDNTRFMDMSRLTPTERRERRHTLGVEDEHPVIVYASKFQRHKRPQDVINACEILASEGLAFHLMMAGSGEMERELKDMVGANRLPRVHFLGFINQSDLPGVYAAGDVFVLPSEEEPWGLVVNEAMCAGLPVIATSAVGSVQDLIRDGENGLVYEPGDVEGLAAALRPTIVNPELRAAMSRRSIEIISNWGFEQCREGLRAAVAGLKKEALASSGAATASSRDMRWRRHRSTSATEGH
jgi:glycosyltransferase involved in cell wall biosynthesis